MKLKERRPTKNSFYYHVDRFKWLLFCVLVNKLFFLEKNAVKVSCNEIRVFVRKYEVFWWLNPHVNLSYPLLGRRTCRFTKVTCLSHPCAGAGIWCEIWQFRVSLTSFFWQDPSHVEGIAPTGIGGDTVLLSFAILGLFLSLRELLRIDFLPTGALGRSGAVGGLGLTLGLCTRVLTKRSLLIAFLRLWFPSKDFA